MKPTIASIRRLVSDLTLLDPSELSPDRDLLMEGLLDSLQVVKLAGSLEARFGVLLDPFDLSPENFASLSTLFELVERKLGIVETPPRSRRAV